MSRPDKNRSGSFVQVPEATSDIYSSSEGAPALDRVYHAKATLLNNAVQEIGVGKYQVRPQLSSPTIMPIRRPQWWLFVVTGFGWFADNLWPVSTQYHGHRSEPDAEQVVTGLILVPVINEFHFHGPFLKLGQASAHLAPHFLCF